MCETRRIDKFQQHNRDYDKDYDKYVIREKP